MPPHPSEIIEYFTGRIKDLFGENLQGIYITGSLALNDFHPDKSDIDVVILCHQLPDRSEAARITQIHNETKTKHASPPLNCVYVPVSVFTNHHPESAEVLHYLRGKLFYSPFEMATVTMIELQQHAITVSGPEASTLPVQMDQHSLNAFLHKNINTYWTHWNDQYEKQPVKYLLLALFPPLTEWSILGIARQYATLRTGKILSKTQAGEWIIKQIPDQYHPSIIRALGIRKQATKFRWLPSLRFSINRANETIRCNRFLISKFKESYNSGNAEK